MNFSFHFLLLVWVFCLNLIQTIDCLPLPSAKEERLEKRNVRLQRTVAKAQASLYRSGSKITKAMGAGKVSSSLDAAAQRKGRKVEAIGHKAFTKAQDRMIGLGI